ncbi:family 2A encapsulin nanocompartment cargo protein cysteine desulfurase [Nocardia lasii]|uniref:cysteine desulfurase n=1 Tax=Nocardia lasii TaxID=1616107 RepID=A0ABW1JMT4_9NOCA
MTTPRPTGAEPGGQPSAAGLPDEATLTRLAGEFFAMLPTGVPGGPGGVSLLQPDSPSAPDAGPFFTRAPLPTNPIAPAAVSPPGSTVSRPSAPASTDPSAHPAGPGVTRPSGPTTAHPAGASVAPALASPVDSTSSRPSGPSTASPAGASVSRPTASPPASGGSVPPGGPTPVPTVPDWGASPGLGASAPVDPAGVHVDPFFAGLPSLREVLSPPRSPGAAPAAGAPSFYFLDGAPSAAIAPDPHPAFDVHAVRADFPILAERVNGHQLVWFDNAATTQKPRAVIDRLAYFYEHENSNIHRAAHELAARSTDAYENARETVARFLGAGSAQEIVFVRGATEGINLVAQTWGRQNLREGDEILISHLEHHANIVPWQLLAAETGARIQVIPVDDRGQLLLDEYTRLLTDRTKLVSVTQVSNALGTVTPVREIVAQARRVGATVLVDGAQSVPHTPIDVRDLDADFFVFSGHKLFGPTGIGAVYGKAAVLEDMPPWQGGGNMIADVTLERSVFGPPPGRFEAGTGNIADAVGLAAAIEYVERIGMDIIGRYEHELLSYATPLVAEVPGVRLIGTAAEKASVLSFVLDGCDPVDVGKALNERGIAVRAGHHCAQPILRRLGVEATVRPSFAFYNTVEEIDRMVRVLHEIAGRR